MSVLQSIKSGNVLILDISLFHTPLLLIHLLCVGYHCNFLTCGKQRMLYIIFGTATIQIDCVDVHFVNRGIQYPRSLRNFCNMCLLFPEFTV